MDIIKLVLIAVFGLVTVMLIKKLNTDCAFYISCLLGIYITVFSIGVLIPVFNYIGELEKSIKYGNFANGTRNRLRFNIITGTEGLEQENHHTADKVRKRTLNSKTDSNTCGSNERDYRGHGNTEYGDYGNYNDDFQCNGNKAADKTGSRSIHILE